MSQGKLKENIMLRSVLRPLGIKNNSYKGYGLGPDGAFQAQAGFGAYVDDDGVIAVNQACNEMYALGACSEDIYLSLNVRVAQGMDETELKKVMSTLGDEIKKLGVNYGVVNACYAGCENMDISAMASARAFEKAIPKAKDILVVGKVGQAGLIHRLDSDISQMRRLPAEMIEKAENYKNNLTIKNYCKEIFNVDKDAFVYPVSEGGIFAALWNFSSRVRAGFEIDPRLIPIDQSTVEICEELNLNPYEMLSVGSAIVLSEKSEEILEKLSESKIPIKKIGILADNNDKVLFLKDEKRFLDKPKTDESFR